MKEETKVLIKKCVVLFSPVFTLIMLMLPWISIYKVSYLDGEPSLIYKTYLNGLKMDLPLVSKIIMIVTLVGVISSLVIYLVSLFIKNREKLLVRVASFVLFSSSVLLLFCSIFRTSFSNYKEWIDFLTIPYGLLLVYNVISVYLVYQKK